MFKKWTALVVVLFLSFLLVQFASAQTPQDNLDAKLSKHIDSYNLNECNFVEALVRISNDFKIPMGIEWVNSPAGRASVSISRKGATVQEVLESVTKTIPGYQVRIMHGMVHVANSELVSDQQNFLKLKIDSFSAHGEILEGASFKLRTLIAPRQYGKLSVVGPGDSRVNVEMKNATVEEVLDALALASMGKIWVVTFADDPTLTKMAPVGMRRTMSLWTDQPISDPEQPVWSFLRWGDPMPSSIC